MVAFVERAMWDCTHLATIRFLSTPELMTAVDSAAATARSDDMIIEQP